MAEAFGKVLVLVLKETCGIAGVQTLCAIRVTMKKNSMGLFALCLLRGSKRLARFGGICRKHHSKKDAAFS